MHKNSLLITDVKVFQVRVGTGSGKIKTAFLPVGSGENIVFLCLEIFSIEVKDLPYYGDIHVYT